jgi:hypothetical protein
MAQFSVIPSRHRVEEVFSQATGLKLVEGAIWTQWHDICGSDLSTLKSYIRPCHQRILMETMAGQQSTPCALLRQLLRPHGWRIHSKRGHFILEKEQEGKGVVLRAGKTLIWEESSNP